MSDQLILFGDGMDQSLPTVREFDWVAKQVTKRMEEAIQNRDLGKATELVQELIKIAKVSGRELARVLYQLESNWAVFDSKETFEEWADRESGLHPHTIERYVRVESLLTSAAIPEQVRSELSDRNLAELFPLANMIEQGYELTLKDWDKVLIQPDESSIRAVVREIKGQEPRSTALILSMDHSGSLWVTKDGERKFVGSLELEEDSPIVRQAIERITRNSGILK
jgi:hypothetical protein